MQEKETTAGLIHIYCGCGKGKTTAAAGLACRSAGRDRKVIFCQFLKGSETGEISSLKKLGAIVIRSEKNMGFYFGRENQKKEFCEMQQKLLCEALNAVKNPDDGRLPDLIVLDEVLDALDMDLISESELCRFVDEKPEGAELILTGRAAPAWLSERAAYITEMEKKKHPWDSGIVAREGIEY